MRWVVERPFIYHGAIRRWERNLPEPAGGPLIRPREVVRYIRLPLTTPDDRVACRGLIGRSWEGQKTLFPGVLMAYFASVSSLSANCNYYLV